jgi:hypothetical protein
MHQADSRSKPRDAALPRPLNLEYQRALAGLRPGE